MISDDEEDLVSESSDDNQYMYSNSAFAINSHTESVNEKKKLENERLLLEYDRNCVKLRSLIGEFARKNPYFKYVTFSSIFQGDTGHSYIINENVLFK